MFSEMHLKQIAGQYIEIPAHIPTSQDMFRIHGFYNSNTAPSTFAKGARFIKVVSCGFVANNGARSRSFRYPDAALEFALS